MIMKSRISEERVPLMSSQGQNGYSEEPPLEELLGLKVRLHLHLEEGSTRRNVFS